MRVTVILGPEYDKTLRTTVMDVMEQLGASVEVGMGPLLVRRKLRPFRRDWLTKKLS